MELKSVLCAYIEQVLLLVYFARVEKVLVKFLGPIVELLSRKLAVQGTMTILL